MPYAREASKPLYQMALAGQVGGLAGVDFGDRFKMEKGMFQCTLTAR